MQFHIFLLEFLQMQMLTSICWWKRNNTFFLFFFWILKPWPFNFNSNTKKLLTWNLNLFVLVMSLEANIYINRDKFSIPIISPEYCWKRLSSNMVLLCSYHWKELSSMQRNALYSLIIIWFASWRGNEFFSYILWAYCSIELTGQKPSL